jgi:beta-lactamase superfamily II metal-dependent hydrolase
MRKIHGFFLGVILLLFASQSSAQEDSVMYAHFINVGQAASVLLEFPCGAILIDAGAQDETYHKALIDYLGHFFQRRKDLDSTLALLMVTHPHIDHNEALYDIAQHFRVDRYIDDGLRVGSGKANQVYMQDNAATSDIQYRSYSFEEITQGGNKNGVTDTIIDPVDCSNGDPQIILYSGRFEQQPEDWTSTDFKNYNNHSLVIKVIFGKSSFLFTGDLETKGIQAIVDEYAGTSALDVDVLMVGHHGAANATTDEYLKAVTPRYAVISCGEWDFGKGASNPFTTYAYGHPRINTINLLEEYISGQRPEAVHVHAAEGSKDFRFIDVDKRVYATPWDHTIIIRADMAGQYKVSTDN